MLGTWEISSSVGVKTFPKEPLLPCLSCKGHLQASLGVAAGQECLLLRKLKNELWRAPLGMKPCSDPGASRVLGVCAKERFMSLQCTLEGLGWLQTMLEVWLYEAEVGVRRTCRSHSSFSLLPRTTQISFVLFAWFCRSSWWWLYGCKNCFVSEVNWAVFCSCSLLSPFQNCRSCFDCHIKKYLLWIDYLEDRSA